MNTLHSCLAYYLLAINAVAFIVYGIGINKYKKESQMAHSKTTLLFFGCTWRKHQGMDGMKVWHHKTMHKKFKYGIPAILLMQVALMAYL